MSSLETLSSSLISGFMNSIYVLPILYVVFRIIKWINRYRYRLRVTSKIPGMPIYPILGNLLQVSWKREDVLDDLVKFTNNFKDAPYYKFWLGTHLLIIFHRAESLDFVLNNPKNNSKSVEYKLLYPWLKLGLLNSTGDKWFQRRRMITPTFHFEILNDFLEVMNEQSDIMVDVLAKLHKEGKPIDIFRRFGLCTLDIICETAMSQNVNAQLEDESEYVKAVVEISYRIYDRINKPYLWSDALYSLTADGKVHDRCLKILHGFTRKVIMERSEEFEQSNFKSNKRVAFLDMLLKAKAEDPTITLDDIQEEVDTFMFEGHDTTTAGLAWSCQMIGSHPEVQKKIHQEIDEVFGSNNRQLTHEDLGNLKYLECAIKESMRIFPPVPMHGRDTVEDLEFDGHIIPKGTTLRVFQYMIHRDEKYFPDPERFDPDRFLPENSADRHPYAYVPFSAGKRNCIGQRFAMMEEKVLLANLLRRFEIKALRPTSEIKQLPELILKPEGGIPVSLTPRVYA